MTWIIAEYSGPRTEFLRILTTFPALVESDPLGETLKPSWHGKVLAKMYLKLEELKYFPLRLALSLVLSSHLDVFNYVLEDLEGLINWDGQEATRSMSGQSYRLLLTLVHGQICFLFWLFPQCIRTMDDVNTSQEDKLSQHWTPGSKICALIYF